LEATRQNPNEIQDNPEIKKEKNHEAKFSRQERKLEEEIISLKIKLEEAKRIEEVMKNPMMKKEEEVENLEYEVVMLRVYVFKLSNKVEEKCHRLLERKNEETIKSYVEVLKGMNHGQQESKRKDTFSRRPYTFR
jgi:hypothetical protein